MLSNPTPRCATASYISGSPYLTAVFWPVFSHALPTCYLSVLGSLSAGMKCFLEGGFSLYPVPPRSLSAALGKLSGSAGAGARSHLQLHLVSLQVLAPALRPVPCSGDKWGETETTAKDCMSSSEWTEKPLELAAPKKPTFQPLSSQSKASSGPRSS